MKIPQLCGIALFWMVLNDSLILAQEKLVIPTPSNMIAIQAVQALDRSFSLSGERPLAELAKYLTDEVGVPVWLDERAVKFAKLDASQQMISFAGEKAALRTTLHRTFMPIGLRIKVDNEGLVITVDTLALARQGIGTSAWVNADDEEDVISAALNEPASFTFSARKLSEVVEDIAEQYKINILVDHRSLEEIGVTADLPVTISIKRVKLKSALRYILKDMDLTFINLNGVLWITAAEGQCEANLLDRIYWIEGTEFDSDTLNDLITLVQTTISPDIWEALGGPSTMTVGPKSDRPFVLVSTTRAVHEDIDQLLKRLRDANFDPGPEIKMEKSVE